MAIVNFSPFVINSIDLLSSSTGVLMSTNGNRLACIGTLFIKGGGTKTLSAAGNGRILYLSGGGTTWANGGSTANVGVMDINASGIEDGTFDVTRAMTVANTTLTNNSIISCTMTTGTKNMTHGTEYAIVIESTTMAGGDAISVDRVTAGQSTYEGNLNFGFPYGTQNGGKTVLSPVFTIIFDDGTYGWILGYPLGAQLALASTVNFNLGTSPDEYGASFIPPVTMSICGAGVPLSNINTGDLFELILYSDPFGTPVAQRTWAPNPDWLMSGPIMFPSFTSITLTGGQPYAVTIRPTTAGGMTWTYYDNAAGFNILKNVSFFGTDLNMISRTDNTGAFAVTQNYHIPYLSLRIDGIDSTPGGSGGQTSYVSF